MNNRYKYAAFKSTRDKIVEDIARKKTTNIHNDELFGNLWVESKSKFLFRINKLVHKDKLNWNDFEKIKLLGEGSFGKVYLVRRNGTKLHLALKVINKQQTVQTKGVEVTINEKHILSVCDFPFLLSYYTSFQTNDYLVLITEVAHGGDLYDLVVIQGKLPLNYVKFYSAQILLVLTYLYNVSIIHRDLKPENILLTKNGYIRLADFGIAKILTNGHTNTYTGTLQYMAPEVFIGRYYNYSVDWWSFGCIIYELIEGKTPFYDKDKDIIQSNIKRRKFHFTENFCETSRVLINGLLQIDAINRIGCGTCTPIDARQMKFFEGIDWRKLYEQSIEPPYKPVKINFGELNPDPALQGNPDTSKEMHYGAMFQDY